MNANKPSQSEKRSMAQEKAKVMREAQARKERRTKVMVTTIVAVVVLVLVAVVSLFVMKKVEEKNEAEAPPQNVTEWGGLTIGSADAPVDVKVFSDFECPNCKGYDEAFGPLLKSFAEQGAIRYTLVPVSILDRQGGQTKYSTRSAAAATCVADSGDKKAYVAFTQGLFANQQPHGSGGLTDEKIATIASSAGVNQSAIDCMNSDRFEKYIGQMTLKANSAGLKGTPFITIDDKSIDLSKEGNKIEQKIREKLKEKGSKLNPTTPPLAPPAAPGAPAPGAPGAPAPAPPAPAKP